MGSSNHTARSILDAFYAAERVYMASPPDQRDFSPLAATIAPTCRLEQTSALPYAGTYFGPDGMQDWSQQMADRFSVVDVQNPEIFERPGSDRIVVVSTIHLKVRKTGEELDFPFCQVVTVDLERGQITEMRPFYWDVAEVNRALQ
ncbi:hypothetical protein BO70DRAFT_366210 [Aspergillus heteromorphus CBS 117.55]|uniref:SnoaL-like domain-containing protein n=1 Tax=Aspergillus heteromorphus CBS 117.55 TaxID=1448321 RepID=A0A317V1I6_9EURO|nr:uncharacterized protein BO70DRAFT_366210 [Aspergillus heteromorphus CBS 117.55]PWY67925.1 hypothetical protein BO70DRAFT_366210 [Aspergillus heteromorphus CBS 117.55]